MNKKIRSRFLPAVVALAFFFGSLQKVNAQWVNIPDANFRAAIAALAPWAISGNSMDTSYSTIVNMTNLDVSGLNIYDLEGVQYFDSLEFLDCSYNNLSTLSLLPHKIVDFRCNNNSLISLPSLPQSILSLRCYGNKISSLPTLPSSLNFLDCNSNLLVNLPSLPSTLNSLYCQSNPLNSLPSLPGSLILLNCSKDSLSSIPSLPTALQNLYCNANSLTALPILPSSLVDLNCSENKLTSLPLLPNILMILKCSDNPLFNLPSLPPSLTLLDCSADSLSSIPSLPSSLQTLYCSSNSLTSLPPLPASIIDIDCTKNRITSLPSLPSSLNYLNCRYNLLTALPTLPSSLVALQCYVNMLTTLPPLPSPLKLLFCDVNLLTQLPPLPLALEFLSCSVNFISCLPLLPEKLRSLDGGNGGYTCLPNKPTSLTSITGPDSLCTSSNSTCYIYPIVSGISYNDDNLNLTQNAGEQGHPNLIIQVQPGNYFFPITDTTGYYSYTVDSGAAYIITANSIPYYNIVPASQSTPALYYAMKDTLNDFALQPIGFVHDLSAKVTATTRPRRGSNVTQIVTTTNNGTQTESADLKYVVDPLLTYVNASPPPSAINGDTLLWNGIYLIPGQKNNFNVTFNISSAIPLGTNLTCDASINPVLPDTTPIDNYDTLRQVVVGSYDPNVKTVTPEDSIPLAKIQQGQWMDYTVRFQNTGTAPAIKVEIRDTLSSNLNLNTIEIISSSHPMTWSIRKKVAYFVFDGINLPDSNANEPASHGFVRYRLKADTNLTTGDEIRNTAYIYFDGNSPVVTNTTVSTVTSLVTGMQGMQNISALIYPNPAHDELVVGGTGAFTILNLLGEEMLKGILTDRRTVLNVKNLPAGIYFVQVVNENGRAVGRFAKE